MEGWIKLHRDIKKHWIWQDPVKLKWWLDILMCANYEDKKVNIGMQLIDCKRGQCVMSLASWAKQWGVSRDIVRAFLILLENDGMISRTSHTKFTQITVCHYDSYQDDATTKSPQSHNQVTTNSQQSHTNKNNKKDKNEKKREVASENEFSVSHADDNNLKSDDYDKNSSFQIKTEEICGRKEKSSAKKENIDCQTVVEMYHRCCPSFPRVMQLTEARNRKIRMRLAEMDGDMARLELVFNTMERSKFLCGDNRQGWSATFDWIFDNAQNWVKVLEGNYKDKTNIQNNANRFESLQTSFTAEGARHSTL
jgi:hypothetical protein